MAKIYCKYCGYSHLDIRSLTNGRCQKNPYGDHHSPYEGDEKDRYFCKHCGYSHLDIRSLTNGRCQKNPHGEFHEPER